MEKLAIHVNVTSKLVKAFISSPFLYGGNPLITYCHHCIANLYSTMLFGRATK